MNQPNPAHLQSAAQIAQMPELKIQHPWNPNSEVYLRMVSLGAGLTRVVLTIGRIPPGKESFAFHSHERDEEYLYILSGRGRAEIGDDVHEVGPGDFMGFPASGVAHQLCNPYDDDLIYLMGGERSGFEVAHFPRLGRQILFGPNGIFAVDQNALTPMSQSDWLATPDGSDGTDSLAN